MSLITYECQRAGHVHEIRQFGQIAQSLYDYFDGRDETALLIGNLNIGEANLDGLIIKNDAIIIVECKDYEGNIFARQNGDWTCDGKVIKGGNGGKSVFEQLRKNQRILRRTIAENAYFTEAQRSDIKGLVVFSKLTSYSDDFDRLNKSWVFVTDVNILSTDFRDNRTGNTIEVSISDDDIFAFLRSIKIDESSLVTDFTDTTIMPSDLFRKENTHNGKHYSTATLLARKTEEADSLRTQIEDLTNQLNTIKVEHQKEVNKKESLINQQKAEILQAMADKLESEKAFVKAQSKVEELSSLIGYNNQTGFDRIREEEAPAEEQVKNFERNVEGETMLSHSEEKTQEMPLADSNKLRKRRFGMKERVLKEFNVGMDSLDAEQISLIERELKKSMIVSGCAGSEVTPKSWTS